jgi:hypothetical protein
LLPRRAIVSLFVCLLGLMLSVAVAQVPSGRTAVVMKDGRTITGELVEVTPASVKIKPNPKAEVIEIEWAKISKLGNGMTRERIVKEWQQTKADQLCTACQGAATTKCSTCDGTAVKPSEKKECETCSGTGNLGECKTPKCKDGQIPCPDKCLKAESFTGAPDADGKRWRSFRGKSGGVAKWSDAHIGELVVMENGEPVNKGKCPTCDGTTRVVDPACGGTSKRICKICKGHGIVGPKCDDCTAGRVTCSTCNGTGLRPVEAPPAAGEPVPETPAEGATP